MVSVAKFQQGVATTLTPLLSRLSAGTEMSSYGPHQWHFLLAGKDMNAYVVPNNNPKESDMDIDLDSDNTEDTILRTTNILLGSLLRVELKPATTTATGEEGAAAAGFGMMLVGTEARGKGVAKLLLKEAIDDDNDSDSSDATTTPPSAASPIRKLLPVCTTAGQPVYRKLGFSTVGTVTSVSTDIITASKMKTTTSTNNMNPTKPNCTIQVYGSMVCNNNNNNKNIEDTPMITSNIRDLVIQMDKEATGYDRTVRLSFMLNVNSDTTTTNELQTIVATAVNATTDEVMGVAVLRREMVDGPYVVGPLIGEPSVALPLVKALATAATAATATTVGPVPPPKISVLVSDHPDLVEEFKSVAQFEQGFEFPAMSLDGKPIYNNGNGRYLGLIHPTLGWCEGLRLNYLRRS